MSIKFACSCGKAYKVPEKFSGKRVKCKKCGEPIRVPSESQSGVQSQRAAAVSKRSVLASGRLDKTSGIHERSSKSSRTSSRSARKSARVKSSRVKSGRSSSKSGRSKSKRSRPGSGTERFTPLDLTEGNRLKKYQKKKEGEEFKRGEGRLTYYEDGKPKKAFKVGRDGAKIGREDSCDISLPSASVSAEHLKLEYKLGTFILTDLQSTNGVLVNGRSVRRASLKDGDVLQLGEAIVRIDCG